MKKVLALILALMMVFLLVSCGSGSSSGESSDSATTGTASEAAGAEEAAASDETTASDETEAVTANLTYNEDGGVVVRVGTTDVLGSFLLGSTVGSNHRGASLVFDMLFEYDADGNQSSRVLEDWYYEDDCTIVLKLKDGITFSNGDQLTGEDVIFSLDVYAQNSSSIAAMFTAFNPETSYVEDDGLTVVLKTDEPYGPGLAGCGSIPLYDKSYAEEIGLDSEEWITGPVGSGPYECVEFVTDSHFICKLRDDYWDDSYETGIDEFDVYYYPEGSTMFVDLETGALDIALNITTADYERAEGGIDGIAIATVKSKDPVFLSLDVDGNEYLQNEKVREAICYGVDWNEVMLAGKGDVGEICTSIISRYSPYHVDVGTYEYDPDRAAEALAESGYTGEEITLNMVSTNEEIKDNMFTVIQYYLSQLGITYTLDNYDFGTALGYWLEEGGADSIFQDSDVGSVIGEPFASLRYIMKDYSPFPVCSISDEYWNELATSAFEEVDTDARIELYAELQQYTYDNYLLIPIYENADPIAWRTDVIADTGITSIDCGLRNVQIVK